MDIETSILQKAHEKGSVRVAEIVQATGFSRAYIFRFFQKLTENGILVRMGRANTTVYIPANKKDVTKAKRGINRFSRTYHNVKLEEDTVFAAVRAETDILERVSENVFSMVEYAFTEMLNNAIEHSGSLKIKVTVRRENGVIRFEIIDWGIGIFEKLIHTRHLSGTEEAIQDLLKGKQTTDPSTHSGEGIFFTRRIADTFSIRSSAKKIFFNNIIDDFSISTIKPVVGTKILFTVAEHSKKELRDVFRAYSGESFEFTTTEITVHLYKQGTATFISRSQARRLLVGLENFKKIILDFQNVKEVGQGFVDEIFRVWTHKNPHIAIEARNSNADIDFMIKHVIR